MLWERIASSAEQFLLFDAGVDENSDIVTIFFEKLVCELGILENSVFDFLVKSTKAKVEFKVTESPNDMKMLSYLAGKLSNAATYFSTFANVRHKDCNDFSKSFGVENKHFWKTFPYSQRISGAEKAMQEKESLKPI